MNIDIAATFAPVEAQMPPLTVDELEILVDGLDELLRQAWDYEEADGDADDNAQNEVFKKIAGALYTKLTGKAYPDGSSL